MDVSLSLTGRQYALLRSHLFPADGCEAVAIALCGRRAGARHRLLIRKIYLVPYDECSVRRPDRVTWSTDVLVPLLEEANKHGYSVVKLHGHYDYPCFSKADDAADRALFPCIDGWIDADVPHASVILLRDGPIFGRTVNPQGEFRALREITVVGDDLKRWPGAPHFARRECRSAIPEFMLRHTQAFGEGTISILRGLSVGVIGCSGTGSPVVEQLARLGVGRLVLVDPDVIEEKNLNRIFNATMQDAIRGRRKVDVLGDAVRAMGLGTDVETIARNLIDPSTIRTVADCDVVFGCMDSAEGRYILNKLSTFYVLPYFDIGIRIEANSGTGDIEQICGSVHYVQPDGSSLLSRRLINMETVRAEGTRRRNPAAYESLLREKYVSGAPIAIDRPAVISVNTLLAALGVNELLARLHGYRDEPNRDYATQTLSLTHGALYNEPEGTPCRAFSPNVGRGDVTPLLDEVELSEGGSG